MELVYKNEKTLFPVMLALSALVWLLLLVGTLGTVLVYAVAFFLFYCFAQSALISHLKGNGVRITEEQFPELKRQISQCCQKLGMEREPDAYLLQMDGMLNAFATRFLGRDFIVLLSDVVDNLADNPDALNFYIGHEIGHIKRKHLQWGTVLMPASVLPLIGAAYARAKEYTCDRHGLAACADPVSAEYGLAMLAAGGKQWRKMNKRAFVNQSEETEGFWMSFHELTGSYPWLVKRMGAIRALAAGEEVKQPRRNFAAALLALFVPRVGGGVAGAVVTIAVIAIVAAVAIPAYQAYTAKAQLQQAHLAGEHATARLAEYIAANERLPATLEEAGLSARPANDAVEQLVLDSESGELQVVTNVNGIEGRGILAYTITSDGDGDGGWRWRCSARNIHEQMVPGACR